MRVLPSFLGITLDFIAELIKVNFVMCDLQISSLMFGIKDGRVYSCRPHRHAFKISPSRVVRWVDIVISGWKTSQSVPNVTELCPLGTSSQRYIILDMKTQLQDFSFPR